MVEPLRHRQSKEAATDMCSLQPPRHISTLPILLQKSLATLLNDDSVALMRFAVEAIDDGAAQSRPR